MSTRKAVLVGRHKLLPAQEEALRKAGFEIVEQVPQIPSEPGELQKWAQEVKSRGISTIVIQALPPHLIAILLQAGLEVISMKMQAVATVTTEEEAKRLVAEAPEKRTFLPAREGGFRVVEFVGLTRIKRIVIEEEPITTA